MLAALGCVDHVLVFDDDAPHNLLSAIRPDVLVKGGTTLKVFGRELVEQDGRQVHVARRIPGVSTTSLVECLCSQPKHAPLLFESEDFPA